MGSEPCHTAMVTYHETFWVVTGTTAPVIALAVVIALPDSGRAWSELSRQLMPGADPDTPSARKLREALVPKSQDWLSGSFMPTPEIRDPAMVVARRAFMILLMVSLDLILQAGVLAVSLSALAYGLDVMPPWVAIVLTVGGLLLLPWITIKTSHLRKAFDS